MPGQRLLVVSGTFADEFAVTVDRPR